MPLPAQPSYRDMAGNMLTLAGGIPEPIRVPIDTTLTPAEAQARRRVVIDPNAAPGPQQRAWDALINSGRYSR